MREEATVWGEGVEAVVGLGWHGAAEQMGALVGSYFFGKGSGSSLRPNR